MGQSNSKNIYSIAVIGGGSAGVMAANYAVHNNDETILFPGSPKDKKKSRAFWVAKIENMPGLLSYSKAIEQPNREMLKKLEECDFKDKFTLMKNRSITEVTKQDDGHFLLTDNKGEQYLAKFVLLATGVMDVQPVIQGSIQPILPYANIQIVDYCLRCDGHHVLGKKTSVIGHDMGAAWVAIMLYERYQTPEMKILTHGQEPQFDEQLNELLAMYDIEVITKEIVAIRGDHKAHRLDGFDFADGSSLDSEFSFVSLGMLVYNDLAKSLGAEVDRRGFVVTNEKGLSSVEGLYVAGDLRAGLKKQVYTAWDCAVDSINEINRLIRLEKRT